MVHIGLINGLIEQIKEIAYENDSKPPKFSKYVVEFEKYSVPPWDIQNPKYIPIAMIVRGNHA